MELTSLAVQNMDVLRKLATRETFPTSAACAKALGKDKSNFAKSIAKLAEARLVELRAEDHFAGFAGLTYEGRQMVEAWNRANGAAAAAAEGVLHRQVQPDPDQPRRFFDQAKLDELEASIVELDDLIEPIVVRALAGKTLEGDVPAFMLIAGERRWRAIGQAIAHGKWPADRPIPATIKAVDDKTARRMALIENLQRDDLRPIEEARSIQAIAELDGISVSQVGIDLGYTDTWAQTRVRLLKLPEKIQARVEAREMKVEDARAAASLWPKLAERAPIKAKELEAGKITVADAKRWLDEQPEPLDPKSRLVLLELIDAVKARPAQHCHDRTEVQAETVRKDNGPNGVSITHKVDDGGAIGLLKKRGIVEGVEAVWEEGVETNRHRIRLAWNADGRAAEAVPGITDAKKRAAMIAEARVEVLGKAKAEKLEGYATAWLNGPFENDPAVAAEVEAKRQAREKVQAEQAAAAEVRQREAVEARREAEARVQRMAEAETDLREVLEGKATWTIGQLTQDLGVELPLFLKPDGVVVDATGTEVRLDRNPHGYWAATPDPATLALRRFLVGLVNAAGGYITPVEEPGKEVATAPLKVDRETFVGQVAQALLEQPDAGEVLGVEEPTIVDALDRAGAALDAFLADQGISFGAPDYDWGQDGAEMIALGIVEDDLGAPDPNAVRPDDQVDLEEAIDAELSPAAVALATGKAKPIAGDEEAAA